jgi:NAD(P)-dependent dehydrogenase (short-subunit alcohol dehydrogenase family)
MPQKPMSESRQRDENPRAAGPRPPFPPQEQESNGRQAAMTPKPDYGFETYRGHGRLEGKIALVTGADSGIGRAVALAFAREGADVAIGYHSNEDDARESSRVVESAGRQAITIAADVGDDAQARAMVEQVVQRFGRIDILVNNAAHQGKAVERFEDIDAARVERTFRTNIIGMFHLVRHALPHMAEGSAVINVASIQAYNPSGEILDYASTKGAIVAFSKGLAQSLIERGIRVNCVAPGPVWTPLVVQSFDAEKNAEFGKNSPMGRPAQPAELAPAFVFLASSEANYVNGEVLGVTGGKPLG